MINIVSIARSLFSSEEEFQKWVSQEGYDPNMKVIEKVMEHLKKPDSLDFSKTKIQNMERIATELSVSKSVVYSAVNGLNITGFAKATRAKPKEEVVNNPASPKPPKPKQSKKNSSKLYEELINSIRAELREEIRKELLQKLSK